MTLKRDILDIAQLGTFTVYCRVKSLKIGEND